MKYKTRKRLAVELAATQKTNLIYFDTIERLQKRIQELHAINSDLRSRLPKIVSLDTTSRLDASMMPTGVLDGNGMPSPYTLDHEQRPAGSKHEIAMATYQGDRAVSNHAVARALDINCNDCEKCTEMRRRRTAGASLNTETSERLLAQAHRDGHPRMSSWRPEPPRTGVVARDENGGLCVKWEKANTWRPVSKYDTYGQNR